MHILLSIFLFTGHPQAEVHDLQLNLKVGQTYAQNFQSFVTLNQTIMGMDQEIQTEISYKLDFEVTGIAGSFYEMTVQYHEMEMSMTTAMGEVRMSSKKVEDPSDVTKSLMSHLVNKPFYVKMDKSGGIGEVQGLESVIESVFENYPDVPEVQQTQLRSQLDQGYGENAFRGNMELITAVLPKASVRVGEQWTRRVDVKSQMPMVKEATFTLREVTEDQVLIDGSGTMTTSDATTEINGLQAKYITTGESTSKIVLNGKSHWISSAEISQSMSGDVEILPNDQLPEGLKFPMTMEVRTSIKN